MPGPPLLDELRHCVESAEARHPRLTSIVNDATMKLANIAVRPVPALPALR